MDSKIQENCFFYAKGKQDTPFDDKRICAMCMDCWNKEGQPKLWFWEGSKRGYGNYDLKCSMEGCENIIHQRNETYVEEQE